MYLLLIRRLTYRLQTIQSCEKVPSHLTLSELLLLNLIISKWQSKVNYIQEICSFVCCSINEVALPEQYPIRVSCLLPVQIVSSRSLSWSKFSDWSFKKCFFFFLTASLPPEIHQSLTAEIDMDCEANLSHFHCCCPYLHLYHHSFVQSPAASIIFNKAFRWD